MHPRPCTPSASSAAVTGAGRVALICLFVGVVVAMAACSETPVAGADVPAAADAGGGDAPIAADADADVAADTTAAVDVFACPGGHNCACVQHTDCLSGLCFDLGEGKRCTEPCEDAPCKGDRVCRRVVLGGKGGWMCVAARVHLCDPCKTSTECEATGLADSVCVDYGARGAFCGARCLGDADCGEDYGCRAVRAIDGGETLQCVRVDNLGLMAECGCSAEAIAQGKETLCRNDGDGSGGSCGGKRSCSTAGLSACSASAPKAETCDGVDNDCDGQTDEDSCADGNPCTDDSCDPSLGCVHDKHGRACDADGSVCTAGDQCKAGACAAGVALTCDDGNPCTTDTCDKALGCQTKANDAATCDADGSACTVGDKCTGGVCAAGVAKVCDDGKICTLDACDPKTGACSNTLVAALSCDDGDPCTHTDLCDAKGACGGKAVSCDDGNPCTTGSCSKSSGCVAAAVTDGASCEDGNLCTLTGTCVAGVCAGVKEKTCTTTKTCVASRCDGKTGLCVEQQAKEGASCTDGKACTTFDACSASGACAGATNDCDDGNFCTKDSCDEGKGGCQYVALTGVCDDGDVCTIGESCKTVGGKTTCVAASNKVCDDNNVCTADSCDAKAGCVAAPTGAGTSCDDGDACTEKDVCAAGKCVGTAKVAAVGTLAGSAQGFKDGVSAQALFSVPSGLARDAAGVIYVADTFNNRIRKIAADGTVSTYAGQPLPGQDDGIASGASFRAPTGLALASNGDLFIADRDNHLIRKITASGTVSTLAGSNVKDVVGVKGGYADGTGVAAKFNRPSGLVLSGGALYAVDTDNNRVRKVTLAGAVTTVAGSGTAGFADGKGVAAAFNKPEGIGVSAGGVLYIGDTGNHRVRAVATDGTVSTLAGSGTGGFKDGKGSAAQFNAPMNIWVDGLGVLLVADSKNHRIRSLKTDGTVTVYAGAGADEFADGTLATAKFDQPSAIITDGKGKAWIADRGNHRVRSVDDGPKQCLIAAQASN